MSEFEQLGGDVKPVINADDVAALHQGRDHPVQFAGASSELLAHLLLGERDFALAEEFEDRFGELPPQIVTLLRLAKLKTVARKCGIERLEAGPTGLAVGFRTKPKPSLLKVLSRGRDAALHADRIVFATPTHSGNERIGFFEDLFAPLMMSPPFDKADSHRRR